MKRIEVVGPTVKRIIDITPSTIRRIEPEELAKALGAEPCPEKLPGPLGPITLYAVRQELFRRLRSRADRPASDNSNGRPNIPLSDRDLSQLEELARQCAAETELAPTPSQVGSALLSLAIRSMTTDPVENGENTTKAALFNELARQGTP